MNTSLKLSVMTAAELLEPVQTGTIDPNFIDQNDDSPIIAAMHMESAELVEALLKCGANPNLETPEGDFPLNRAAIYAMNMEIGYLYLDSLLAHGADLNSQFFPPPTLCMPRRGCAIGSLPPRTWSRPRLLRWRRSLA